MQPSFAASPRTIAGSTRSALIASWVFALLWNLLSAPSAWFAVREAIEKGNRLAWIVLIFPLAGVALVAGALRTTLRWRK
ncbi:MAG TPA: hypothetical protein VFT43_07000, partial [Candidatus Polarisedimenticolia bacterium]|nr:hypothetical protein [Candidatus Polarisedimenticolia bacterium]